MPCSIFYFEDEPELLTDLLFVLRMDYEVEIGATEALIKHARERPVDLVILDLMIHHYSFDEDHVEVENIRFEDVIWEHIGVEFLKRLRASEYAEFGLPASVPVVVATAAGSTQIEEQVRGMEISAYMEKPVPLGKLTQAVADALHAQAGQ